MRREAASREAELAEQAATSQAEAEAAAQLLAAMRPKGDNVLATLWTEVCRLIEIQETELRYFLIFELGLSFESVMLTCVVLHFQDCVSFYVARYFAHELLRLSEGILAGSPVWSEGAGGCCIWQGICLSQSKNKEASRALCSAADGGACTGGQGTAAATARLQYTSSQ